MNPKRKPSPAEKPTASSATPEATEIPVVASATQTTSFAVPIATPSPNVWSKSALLSKAQRYAEQMNSYQRDDWRFGLWASLTLEILARAALANVSPALLANAGKDTWDNLYYALGNVPNTAKFIPRSIDASEVFTRLKAILPNFDERLAGVAGAQLARRNEDLHSGGTPFDDLAPASWLPLFYEACDVLMKSMGGKLADLIGAPDAKAATQMIAAAKDESAKAVNKSVSAHKTVWGNKSRAEQTKHASQAGIWATKQDGHRVNCPACGCVALVNGTAIAPPTQQLEEDTIVERQQILPSRFECIACGLKISGLPQLHACGLGNPFTSTTRYSAADYYLELATEQFSEPDNND